MSTRDRGETASSKRGAFALGSPPRFLLFLWTVGGAAEAAGLTLYAGRQNSSHLLMALFLIWVLSPFVALAWACAVSNRWAPRTRSALAILTLVVTAVTLAIYARVAFGPPVAKTAFAFLVVPLASWVLSAAVALLEARAARR